MNDYLQNPVPFLSENNVKIICNKMDEGFDFFVEYGMGSSTLYFINKFSKARTTYISVENTIAWFKRIFECLGQTFHMQGVSKSIAPWSLRATYQFIRQLDGKSAMVPVAMSRRSKWKETLLLGPFYRFSPLSPSRLSGRLPLWPLFRQVFIGLAFVRYLLVARSRPTDGECRGSIGNISVICRNVPPAIKDQYGESPSKDAYIEAGLAEIRNALHEGGANVKALFCIDGGPRGEIVREILALEDAYCNFFPTIYLCEAHRAYYKDIIQTRPSGVFLPGTNLTITGSVVQEAPQLSDEAAMMFAVGKTSISKEELAEKEVWLYERSDQQTGTVGMQSGGGAYDGI